MFYLIRIFWLWKVGFVVVYCLIYRMRHHLCGHNSWRYCDVHRSLYFLTNVGHLLVINLLMRTRSRCWIEPPFLRMECSTFLGYHHQFDVGGIFLELSPVCPNAVLWLLSRLKPFWFTDTTVLRWVVLLKQLVLAPKSLSAEMTEHPPFITNLEIELVLLIYLHSLNYRNLILNLYINSWVFHREGVNQIFEKNSDQSTNRKGVDFRPNGAVDFWCSRYWIYYRINPIFHFTGGLFVFFICVGFWIGIIKRKKGS